MVVALLVKVAAKELVRAAKESVEVVRVVLELVAAHVNLVAEEVIDSKNNQLWKKTLYLGASFLRTASREFCLFLWG